MVRGRHGAIGVGEPKSHAGRRTLALPSALVAIVREHLAVKGVDRSAGEALLFTAPDGGFLRYSNWVRRRWYPAAVGAGVGAWVTHEATKEVRHGGLGFHDLRRAHATGLLAEGVDVKTAQTLLGHSEARLTLDVYAQAVTELGQAAADAMGARFLAPPRDGRAIGADPADEPS